MESESMYVYNISDDTLLETAYRPMDKRFGPTVMTDAVIDSVSIGAYSYSAVRFDNGEYGYLHTSDWTLGTLSYQRGDNAYALFGPSEK
jgi:hypothetical protein